MIGLIISLFAVFTFVLVRSQKEALDIDLRSRITLMRKNLVERGKTLSDNLAFQVEDAIASFNLMSIIKQTDKAVREQDELDYIILTNSKGIAHIHTKIPQLQETLLEGEEDKFALQQENATINEFDQSGVSYMEFIVPIQISDESWGVLRLGYTLDELNKVIFNSKEKARNRIKAIVIRGFFTAFAALIIGAGLVSLLFSRLSKPLISLTKTAHDLAGGDFDAADKIVVHSKDEVGVLAQTFIEMSKDLKTSYAKLEEYSHNLEQNVRERTIELAEARDQAVSANESKSRFLANMSHEIRTPLTSIVGFTAILLKQGKESPSPEEIRQYLEIIKVNSETLSELINNILDLSKIEAGKTTLSMEDLNLRLLVQGIFHTNKAQAMQKNLDFTFSYSPELPEIVYSDRTKLNQILMNLTSNAIKFTPKGKAVSIKAARLDDFVLFTIEDQGIGIPLDRQNIIFEAFTQAEASTTRKYGGTGLGLSIVKNLIKLLGGEIGLKSEEGKGTVFMVKIPLVESSEDVESKREKKWDDIIFAGDNKILVVEDNIMNRRMLNALFEKLSLSPKMVDNGKDGIEAARKQKPDLIIMDMHMPEMDGLEATRQIRLTPECSDIPIVALSADAFSEQQAEAGKAGVSDYLIKPLNINKFITLLKKYLRYEQGVSKAKKDDKSPIPHDLYVKLAEEFTALEKIPYYLTGKITAQTKKIANLCKDHDSPFSDILKQVEDAAFSKDTKKAKDLIQKAIECAEREAQGA